MQDLSRDEVLAAIARRRKEVEPLEVEEWGGTVYIRRLSPSEVSETGLGSDKDNKDPSIFPVVLAATLTDRHAELLFSTEDVEELAKADMALVARVFGEVVRVNGLMTPELAEALAELKGVQIAGTTAIEDAEEVFAEAQPEPSSSD